MHKPLAFSLGLLAAALPFHAGAEIRWHSTLAAACNQAGAEGKPVLAIFHHSNTSKNSRMLMKALALPRLESLISESFVAVDFKDKVPKEFPRSTSVFLPVVMVLDSAGKQISRLEGFDLDQTKSLHQWLTIHSGGEPRVTGVGDALDDPIQSFAFMAPSDEQLATAEARTLPRLISSLDREEKILQQSKESPAAYAQRAQKQAKAGDSAAQYALALCYHTGHGVPQDLKTAALWYRKSLPHVSKAGFHLGVLHAQGTGVRKSPGLAAWYFLTSAKSGEAAAMYNIALCYENGHGCAPNRVEYLRWIYVAAQKGLEAAKTIAAAEKIEKPEELRKAVIVAATSSASTSETHTAQLRVAARMAAEAAAAGGPLKDYFTPENTFDKFIEQVETDNMIGTLPVLVDGVKVSDGEKSPLDKIFDDAVAGDAQARWNRAQMGAKMDENTDVGCWDRHDWLPELAQAGYAQATMVLAAYHYAALEAYTGEDLAFLDEERWHTMADKGDLGALWLLGCMEERTDLSSDSSGLRAEKYFTDILATHALAGTLAELDTPAESPKASPAMESTPSTPATGGGAVTVDDLLVLLEVGTAPDELLQELSKRGFAGKADTETLAKLRKAGASTALLLAVKKAAP